MNIKPNQIFHSLNRGQWLGVLLWGTVFSCLHVARKSYSWPVSTLLCVLYFLIGYLIAQWMRRKNDPTLILVVKTPGIKEEPSESEVLIDELLTVFNTTFQKGKKEFVGWNCDDEQVWFYFKGADPYATIKSIQPLLQGISLPEGTNWAVMIGPNNTKELPVFATV